MSWAVAALIFVLVVVPTVVAVIVGGWLLDSAASDFLHMWREGQ